MTAEVDLARLEHGVYRLKCAHNDLFELLDNDALQAAFELVPSARPALEAALHALLDVDAAVRGSYEAAGGFAANLDCGFHPPCERPGGPDCECLNPRGWAHLINRSGP